MTTETPHLAKLLISFAPPNKATFTHVEPVGRQYSTHTYTTSRASVHRLTHAANTAANDPDTYVLAANFGWILIK